MGKIFHIKMKYSIRRYKNQNMQTDSTKVRLTQSSFGND